MDRNHLQNQQILRLQELSATSRSAISAEYARLRQRLDVPARVLGSLREKPSRWILGSTAAGLTIGLLFPKARKPKQTSSKPPASHRMLGLAWSMVQPVVKAWALNQLRVWLSGRIQHSQQPPR